VVRADETAQTSKTSKETESTIHTHHGCAHGYERLFPNIEKGKSNPALIFWYLLSKLAMHSWVFIVTILLALSAASGQERVDFNRDIRPILADKCWRCHGPDAPNLKIRLRLDSKAGMESDLGGGRRAVIPGSPAGSEMVRRITAADGSLRMPPVYSGRTLSGRETSLLTEWIRQGATWQRHWAFIPPVRPKIPQVKSRSWSKNAIDAFVLARLEREGLEPALEADRAALIRRLSLDLTGLPPTLREIDDFLADQSSAAYEKLIDRLLGSQRYGERMASHWLDLARYADTNGYQIDGERSMWPWRDWVIRAFNRNVPFDQFTIEQLAGDLLPDPTPDQIIATAFNRNHRTNSEDGIVPEEYAVEYVVDRVDTTSTVFLGLTMGCARCHNHKYDPFTQKEYYQLYAYFNSIPEDGRASNYGNSAPWVVAPTAEQEARHKELSESIERTEKELASHADEWKAEQERWARSLPSRVQWFPGDNLLVCHSLDEGAAVEIFQPDPRIDVARPDQQQAPEKPDGKKEEDDHDTRQEMESEPRFRNGAPRYVEAPTGLGVEFRGDVFFDAGRVADFNFRDRLKDYKDQFALSAWFWPESARSGAIITHLQERSEAAENHLPRGKGYGLFFHDGKVHFNVVNVWADDSFRVETERTLPIRQWHHVLATFDSTEPYEKVRIYINGEKQKLHVNLARLFRTFGDPKAHLRFGAGGGPEWLFRGKLDELRVYKSLPEPDQVAILSCADSLAAIAAIPPAARSAAQRLKLRNAWLDTASPPEIRELWGRLSTLKQAKTALEAEFPTVMVMQELPAPRPAFVLGRGAYDSPGEKVERGTMAQLPPIPESLPDNRLGLARWLVAPENPLLARVTVNRLWQMLFGRGLVETAEDFGSQGALPSHPELLDWLAVKFQSSGWDVKALLKTIVMSATYRQSSNARPEAPRRDPDNRLLTRGARFRLPAEMIRDQALYVSGLLVEKLGGPPVRPYQPEGLWKDMTFSNMTEYHQDKGEGLWRRSLYTFWKRTILNPGMFLLDASPREFCTVRETRTNTPLQALNLMNDVTYIEAARMLAQRMTREGGATPQEGVSWAFRVVTSRQPDESELKILLGNLNTQREYYRAYPADAARLLAVGERAYDEEADPAEMAARTAVASLILNLDEVVTKQ
jgi:hypothetical protein